MGKAWSWPVQVAIPIRTTARYKNAGIKKSEGATFTPSILADFVASQILATFKPENNGPIRLLDPAVGDGELLHSLLRTPRRIGIYRQSNDVKNAAPGAAYGA